MAITYHSGERIQGLEADNTPTLGYQGYSGGNGRGGGTTYGGGGGGGAGGVGQLCGQYVTGNGGIGIVNPIVGSTYGQSSGGNYYIGGGGYGGKYAGTFGVVGLGNGYGGGGSGLGSVEAGTGGAVILKFLTSDASYTTSGSPDVDESTTNYTILTYTSNGTFILSSGTPDVQYVVLAGGGSSGSNNGYGGGNGAGGGGAGGFLTGTKLSLASDTYTITRGTGGSSDSNGTNSVFSDIISIGGGAGAPNDGPTFTQASIGGSGGGGAGFSLSQNATGASATSYILSLAIIPTNVPDYTRFEETDTRKMYSLRPASIPTYETDFSTNIDWTSTDSQTAINTSTEKLEINFTTANAQNTPKLTYDLTSVSDTAWVLNFDLETQTITNPGNYNYSMFIGLSDESDTHMTNAQDFIGFHMHVTSGGSRTYKVVDTLAGSPYNNGTAMSRTFSEETVYVSIKRLSGTSYSVELFEDSARTISLESSEQTVDVGTNNLQFIKITGYDYSGHATGALTQKIDNMKFYNGITVAEEGGWKEKGTI
jgi:hypothetical protein